MASSFVLRAYEVGGTLAKEQAFPGLPIRIGRNPLNDFELPSNKVSSFHARLDYEDGRVWVYDLNSKNGVFIKSPHQVNSEQVVPAGRAEVLVGTTHIMLGQFRLSLDPGSAPASERGPLRAGFVLGNSGFWGGPAGAAPALPPLGGGGPGELPRLSGGEPMRGSSSVEPVQASVRGWGSPQDQGNPALHTGFHGHSSLSMEQLALAGLRELAESLAPGCSLASGGDLARFITRLHDSLDAFTRSYIPLREGYSQFVSSMDLQRAKLQRSMYRSSGYLAVEGAQTPEQVSAALLNVADKSEDSYKAIEDVFSEIMVHQVAVLDGVMRGVRALLEELSPERIEESASEGAGMLGFGRKKDLWKAYSERHAELAEEDQAFSRIFGREFSESYREYRRRRPSTGGSS